MTVSRKITPGFLFFFVVFIASVFGQNKPADETATMENCCQKQLDMVMDAIGRDEISRENVGNVSVVIDRSAYGKSRINAETYVYSWKNKSLAEQKKENLIFDYKIVVTEKFFLSLSEEGLIYILAHEFGHIMNPEDTGYALYLQDYVEGDEYYSDGFAIKILVKMGLDPGVVILALNKGIMDDIQFGEFGDFLLPTEEWWEMFGQAQKRIIRMKALIAEENKK
ncbi:MAG: hypothetical protein Q7R94_02020 [bacterium]|nr:hypothetical protein [bacterium]